MSLFEGSNDMEAKDPRILMAIEHAVAASRWRIAARFEGPQDRARFLRMSKTRSAAATAILDEVTRAAGFQTGSPRLTHDGTGGLGSRRP